MHVGVWVYRKKSMPVLKNLHGQVNGQKRTLFFIKHMRLKCKESFIEQKTVLYETLIAFI